MSEIGRITEKIQANFDQELMNKMMGDMLTTQVEKAKVSSTLEGFFEMKKLIDRRNKIYFLVANHLPDDCLGIMYVRQGDMPSELTPPAQEEGEK